MCAAAPRPSLCAICGVLNMDDEFAGNRLRPPGSGPWSAAATRGRQRWQLHLPPPSRLGAVVARRTFTATYKAATTLDFAALPADTYAGLAAVGDPYNALALMAGNGILQIWHMKSSKQRVLTEVYLDACETLAAPRSVGRQRFRFAFSTDGGTPWQPLPTTASP